jgi:hypothetical protein
MENKEAVRPIYSELQGYLSQAPNSEKMPNIREPAFWEQYNNTINELNKVTGNDYNRYTLSPGRKGSSTVLSVDTDIYRQNLGGLIAKLHAKYFPNETPPFAEMPSTIITQSQNQNQSLQVQLVLEVSDLIHEKLGKVQDGSKEKTFLEKIKASLSSVKNVSQLVSLLLTTAHQLGITIEQLRNLFS